MKLLGQVWDVYSRRVLQDSQLGEVRGGQLLGAPGLGSSGTTIVCLLHSVLLVCPAAVHLVEASAAVCEVGAGAAVAPTVPHHAPAWASGFHGIYYDKSNQVCSFDINMMQGTMILFPILYRFYNFAISNHFYNGKSFNVFQIYIFNSKKLSVKQT